jgi:hypothetical protein
MGDSNSYPFDDICSRARELIAQWVEAHHGGLGLSPA